MELRAQQVIGPPSLDLEGRVAIVTGAGNGMGRADALELSRRGARVAIVDIEGEAARATAEEIRSGGSEALALQGDVSVPDVTRQLVAEAMALWGRLDILVSNAGVVHSGTGIADTTDEDWHRTFAVHVDGSFYLVRAAIPHLKASPAGRVIVIASMWGQAGPGHSHAYCAAKGALMALAKNLALELAPFGICVNSIAPGGVMTRMAQAQSPEEYDLDVASIPLGRYADPSEIAVLVSFLASDAGAFITGQTLPINGGQLIGGY